MESHIELLKLILPEFLITHFELISVKNLEEKLHIYFEEKTKYPKGYSGMRFVPKNYLDEITIQYYPLRSRYVYLHIKRSRWRNKTKRKIVKRNWRLVAKETCVNQEFTNFLKDINKK